MTGFFNVLLHLLLLGSLLYFMSVVVVASLRETDSRERLLRIGALMAGSLVTLGVEAAGLDYASLAVGFSQAGRDSLALRLLATLLSALVGVALGRYTVSVSSRSDRMGVRILGFTVMLATTAFLRIYAEAAQARGVLLGTTALPNVGFATALILTVVLTLDPETTVLGSRRPQGEVR